jgi:hypothetical protein
MGKPALGMNSLPDRDRLRAARALNRWWGITGMELRREGYLFSDQQLHDPLLDPIDDEVAIARAVAGERAVWDALTHYERHRVRYLVRMKVEAVGNLRHNPAHRNGLTDWCKAVGEDFTVVQRYIIRARARDRRKAAANG